MGTDGRAGRDDAGDGAPRLKLLLVAPTCDGTDVGEAWVAHQWVKRLAARHDVTLLTYHKRGSTPAAEQLDGLRVIEWTEPPLVGRFERLNSMLKPGYLPYYVRARRWLRAAQKRGEQFDLAHQLTPVAMRYPSPAAGLGIPFLIGPVGGSLDNPAGFEDDGDTAPWFVGLRSLDRFRMRRDPLLARTYDGAACVLAIAPYVVESLADRHPQRIEVLSETALDALPPDTAPGSTDGTTRFLYVGRLVRTKGLRDAIRALAQVPEELVVVLDVVGDGFDREACETLVDELGLRHRVVFHGTKPRAEVDDFYRAADVFLFPSYREPGGNVAFEAMGFGLPLIVSDRGGPGHAVDDSCGIRVHPTDPEQFARDLAAAITRLAEDPALRAELGAAARRRAGAIALWDSKVDTMDDLYLELLGRSLRTPTT